MPIKDKSDTPVKKTYGKIYEIPVKRVETSIFVKSKEEGLKDIICFHYRELGYKKPEYPKVKKASIYVRILEDDLDSNSNNIYFITGSGKE